MILRFTHETLDFFYCIEVHCRLHLTPEGLDTPVIREPLQPQLGYSDMHHLKRQCESKQPGLTQVTQEQS